jgi:hypothetical protein
MVPVPMTTAPSMTPTLPAPAVPAPAAIIPAVVPMPPKRPIIASVAVIARIVAVAGTSVIAAVPWIVAAAKRENYLRLSRALGCKEQAACCEQNNQRFHALNLMLSFRHSLSFCQGDRRGLFAERQRAESARDQRSAASSAHVAGPLIKQHCFQCIKRFIRGI